jgi:hypothetical protein
MDELLRAAMDDYRAGDFGFSGARRLAGIKDQPTIQLVEPAILTILGMIAVAGIWTDPGPIFWAGWHGLAAAGFMLMKWPRRTCEATQ